MSRSAATKHEGTDLKLTNPQSVPMLVRDADQSNQEPETSVLVNNGIQIPRLYLKLAIASLGSLLLVFILLYSLSPRPGHADQKTNTMFLASADQHSKPQGSQDQSNPGLHTADYCTSQACISASALLQSSIDTAVSPCQDFYGFACGGFEKSHSFTADTINSVINRLHQAKTAINGLMFELMYDKNLAKSADADTTELFQTVRYFYMTCMNTLSPNSRWSSQSELLPRNWNTKHSRYSVARILAKPLISYIEAFTSFEEFVARLVMSGSSGLLSLDVKAAIKNMIGSNNGNVISLVSMKFSKLHQGTSSMKKLNIAANCRLLGLQLTAPVEGLVTIESEIIFRQFLMTFRSIKLEFQLPQTAFQLDSKTAKLARGLRFSWPEFLNQLSKLSGIAKIKQARISIEGLAELIRLLAKLEPEVRARRGSYYDFVRLQAALTQSMNTSSSSTFQQFHDSLMANSKRPVDSLVPEKSEIGKYSETCMNTAVYSMPLVVLAMFRSAYVNDSFATISSMTQQIQQAMVENVNNETWISGKSKRKINLKLAGVRKDFYLKRRELSTLKGVYKDIAVRVNSSRNFGETTFAFKDATARNLLVFLTDDNPLESATMILSDIRNINAFYAEPLKTILIPPGILHTYLYHKDMPDYLLFGGIGSIVGHEFAHALDWDKLKLDEAAEALSSGRRFRTARSGKYRSKLQCLIRSYDQLIETEFGHLASNMGNKTASENFADIVGINAAYRAYRGRVDKAPSSGRQQQVLPGHLLSTLTPDQLFFIQYAQFHCKKAQKKIRLIVALLSERHSPSKPRLNGAIMHSNDFARVFHCKPGDSMYLADSQKCHFW